VGRTLSVRFDDLNNRLQQENEDSDTIFYRANTGCMSTVLLEKASLARISVAMPYKWEYFRETE